jgi:drug/metabolite transporter (DMT)-like permease
VAISAAVAIALQLVIARRVIRGELARANGLVLCGVAPSLIVIGSVRAWFAPPHLDVPPPHWLVAIPGLELAAACGCAALAIVMTSALIRARRERAARYERN